MEDGFIRDLKVRSLVKDSSDVGSLFFSGSCVKGYLGFDPTASSLHVGSLLPIILLKRFQMSGHIPFVLVGGATGMIGDPSFKNSERSFLSDDEVKYNVECIHKQLAHLIDFSSDRAVFVDNAEWYKKTNVIEFLREAGKYITVNYMCAKESVKKRIETGISFTEFTYQVMQGYDYYYLHTKYGVNLQFGGADQWGNITTGIELIKKKTSDVVHGITFPLITKSDGTKFGKTESGAVWLNRELTSPFTFYQFWINRSDDEAENLIKKYSLDSLENVNKLIEEHKQHPELRILQKKIAEELTIFVHSEEDYCNSVRMSEIIFGNSDFSSLKQINDLKNAFSDDMCLSFGRDILNSETYFDFISKTCIPKLFTSNGDLRRSLSGGAVSVNKVKIKDDHQIFDKDLMVDGCFMVQKGHKNYCVVKVLV